MGGTQEAVLVREIASSDRLWTRAAVRGGRIFVCFPRWFDEPYMRMSVGELVSPGRAKPYPDDIWNSWKRGDLLGDKFVCVQSVYFDDEGYFWVLDTANPTDLTTGKHGNVIGDGPKLYRFDVRTGGCTSYDFNTPSKSYLPQSYFNDVRICTERQKAFLTDSNGGALIVLDLRTRDSWRQLGAHYSVKAENVVLIIEGRRWLQNRNPPKVDSDGIALSPDRRYLYYQALTGRTLYRIPTDSLINERDPRKLDLEVQEVGQTGAADGIQFGADGRLYLTAIEKNAITRLVHPYDPQDIVPKGEVETVFCSNECQWTDSLTRAADGSLYVTTSRIHLQGDPKEPPRGPFKLFHLQVGKLGLS